MEIHVAPWENPPEADFELLFIFLKETQRKNTPEADDFVVLVIYLKETQRENPPEAENLTFWTFLLGKHKEKILRRRKF